MIKKSIYIIFVSLLCFSSCGTSDDSSSTMDGEVDNDTVSVEQLSNNQGFVNDIVSVEGLNFLAQASSISVRFSSSQAEIVIVTNTRIDVRVPSNLDATSHAVTLIISGITYDLGIFNILQETQLLAASSNGKLYELGVSSGNTSLIGATTYNFLSAFVPVNILRHENTVFFFDTYSPGTSRLVKYNLINNTSESQELVMPTEIIGNEPGIIAFEYDTLSDNIIAVVNENVINGSENLNYIVRINPDTYQVTYTDITFNQISINSTLLKNNVLMVSAQDESYELTAINLASGISETIELSSDYKITQLGHFGDNIYALRSGISIIDGVTPIQINSMTFDVTLYTQNNNQDYSLSSFFGNSFISGDNAYSVITSNAFNVGVLEFNTSTNTYNTQGFNNNSIESNLRILDVIN